MNETKYKIVIAEKIFFARQGIKSCLSMIDINADITELKEQSDLHELNANGLMFTHVLISTAFIETTIEEFILQNNFISTKTRLLITDKQDDLLEIENVYTLSENKGYQQHLSDLHDFFIKKDKLSNENDAKGLSDRETEVLKEIAVGLSNKEIAEKLYISKNTVITHRKNITEKLGIKTISGLTIYALLNKIIVSNDVTS